MLNGNEVNKLQPQNYIIVHQKDTMDKKKNTFSVFSFIKHPKPGKIIMFWDTNAYNKTI